MGLQLKYNGYTFDLEKTLVPISTRFEHDAQGRASRKMMEFRARTDITAAGESAITTAVAAFEVLMVTTSVADNKDLVLYQSNGSTKTPHWMDASASLGGIQVLNIDYPVSTGPEYAVRRTAEVTFRATFNISQDDELIAFTETVDTWGGGARYVHREVMEGKPRKYRVAENTLYHASQSGSATSRTNYPSRPVELFPGHNVEANPRVSKTPVRNQDGSTHFQIGWSWEFESSEVLQADPNVWLS